MQVGSLARLCDLVCVKQSVKFLASNWVLVVLRRHEGFDEVFSQNW